MSIKAFKKNSSGIVLIIVLIVIILMSIVSATIFSQSMSQSKTTRTQVDAIVAEELARGLYWKSFSQSNSETGTFNSACPTPGSCQTTINGRSFNPVITSSGLDINVNVGY